MKQLISFIMIASMLACQNEKTKPIADEEVYIDPALPTIGIIIFDGVISNEILAPLDVFSKHTAQGNKLFNVVFLAMEKRAYQTEEGMRILADFSFDDVPGLNVLVIPSSYESDKQYKNEALVGFVREQYASLDYVATHCAGAFTLGATGMIDGKKVVTYITGGQSLQQEFPKLNVQDDAKVAVAKDGKVFSSNGSLVSYMGSLDLLETLTDLDHRKYVEGSLYLDRLTVAN